MEHKAQTLRLRVTQLSAAVPFRPPPRFVHLALVLHRPSPHTIGCFVLPLAQGRHGSGALLWRQAGVVRCRLYHPLPLGEFILIGGGGAACVDGRRSGSRRHWRQSAGGLGMRSTSEGDRQAGRAAALVKGDPRGQVSGGVTAEAEVISHKSAGVISVASVCRCVASGGSSLPNLSKSASFGQSSGGCSGSFGMVCVKSRPIVTPPQRRLSYWFCL